jgi:hypothetical protein
MSIFEDLAKQKNIKPTGNADKLKPCSRCGNNNFEVRFTINKDGNTCFPYFCKTCNNRSPIIESKEFAALLGLL